MSDIYLRLCIKIVFELFHVMGERLLFQNKIIEWLNASANKNYRLKPINKKARRKQNRTGRNNKQPINIKTTVLELEASEPIWGLMKLSFYTKSGRQFKKQLA